jgi:hypothetical protein
MVDYTVERERTRDDSGYKTCSDEVDIVTWDVKSFGLESFEARSNGHEESQMEGEGNYFKACILERVALGGGCQFEKWRLCNAQHNPIDGFHS